MHVHFFCLLAGKHGDYRCEDPLLRISPRRFEAMGRCGSQAVGSRRGGLWRVPTGELTMRTVFAGLVCLAACAFAVACSGDSEGDDDGNSSADSGTTGTTTGSGTSGGTTGATSGGGALCPTVAPANASSCSIAAG